MFFSSTKFHLTPLFSEPMFSELLLPWISSQNLSGGLLLPWTELKGPIDFCSIPAVATQARPKWCHLKGNVVPARVTRARHQEDLTLASGSATLLCQSLAPLFIKSHLSVEPQVHPSIPSLPWHCGLAPLSPHGLGVMKNVYSRKFFPVYLCYLRQRCSVTGMWLAMWED